MTLEESLIHEDLKHFVSEGQIDCLLREPPSWDWSEEKEWIRVWDVAYPLRLLSVCVVMSMDSEVKFILSEGKIQMVL